MKSNELRIGNYFQWRDIASMGTGIDQITHGQQIMDYIDFKEGIPLTAEWLIMFGAVKNELGEEGEQGHTIYYELDKLTICDWGNGLIMSNAFAHGVRVPLEYVHQLQNLYFALTGEELQLTPAD